MKKRHLGTLLVMCSLYFTACIVGDWTIESDTNNFHSDLRGTWVSVVDDPVYPGLSGKMEIGANVYNGIRISGYTGEIESGKIRPFNGFTRNTTLTGSSVKDDFIVIQNGHTGKIFINDMGTERVLSYVYTRTLSFNTERRIKITGNGWEDTFKPEGGH